MTLSLDLSRGKLSELTGEIREIRVLGQTLVVKVRNGFSLLQYEPRVC